MDLMKGYGWTIETYSQKIIHFYHACGIVSLCGMQQKKGRGFQ